MLEKTYTTFQIAKMCGVRPTTVIKWAKQKKFKAYVTVGGHRRVLETDLLDFLRQYNFPIPEELNGSRQRILIVEDEPAVGQLLRNAFHRSLGDEVEIEWVKDGIGALLGLGQRPPDLVILDVVMPVVDGGQVLATLRHDERTHKVKVIGITGKRLPPEKLKFMQRNTDAFYFKPFDVYELVRKAMSLLGTGKKGNFKPSSTKLAAR